MLRMTGTGCNLLLFEDYTTYNSALGVCGSHLVDQVLDRQLNRSKLTGEEEEEISENKETFFDTLKKPAAVRKYMHQFGIQNDIMSKNFKMLSIIWCQQETNGMQL